MIVTCLLDNKSAGKEVACEHGLSFHIDGGSDLLLFDTGQSGKFIKNAYFLNLNLDQVQYVVLSHGHYDHTGGLPEFLDVNDQAKVLMHPLALNKRFSRSSQLAKENGIPWADRAKDFSHRILWVDVDVEPAPGIRIMTGIKKYPGFDETNDRLVQMDGDNYFPDPCADEVVLLINRNNKPLLFCGCSHTGIVNILKTIEERLGLTHYHMVLGGLHLNGASSESIEKTLNGIKDFRIDHWALNHCTGEEAFQAFEAEFEGKVSYASGGCSYTI